MALAGVIPNLDIDQKMKLYLIWGRPITESCCNSLKVVRFASFCAEKKCFHSQNPPKFALTNILCFQLRKASIKCPQKKVGFKVFVKVNAKRNKHRMWLDQAQINSTRIFLDLSYDDPWPQNFVLTKPMFSFQVCWTARLALSSPWCHIKHFETNVAWAKTFDNVSVCHSTYEPL